MPTFTADQQAKLRLVLGYASKSSLLTNDFQESRTQAVIDRALAIVDELTRPANPATEDQGGIDAKLSAATSDSMAMQVGDLKLSYVQHVAHLNFEGSRLLCELGQILGIEPIYNKYKTTGKARKSYW